MRKFSVVVMYLLLGIICWAMPADKTPAKVIQSDGTTLTLRLVGDEFFHFNTTVDGYTVMRNAAGTYEYAMPSGSRLVLSGMVAHDPSLRSAPEAQLLKQVGKYARSENQVLKGQQTRARARGSEQPRREPVVDYSNFSGLIILIN